jgi:hypothetical protein
LACHAELKGWLLDWIGKGQQKELELAFTLIYNLWQARNDARESQQLQVDREKVYSSGGRVA